MTLVEVEFKGRRKGIYSNPQEFPLRKHDKVIVQADRGEDIGKITLIGLEWQTHLAQDLTEEEIESVLRRASPADLDTDLENRKLEKEARPFFLDFVKKQELVMKLVDAEYQLDHRKLTFYFTSEGRVDFRALVKDLAHHFKTRIDLRQIGARDEAKRLAGVGLCGRELCCSSWVREFLPVTTTMVKEQNLLLNPQKNTGLCGRLRCCLRYEVEDYREVNKLFPRIGMKTVGPRGEGVIEKIDRCTVTCGVLWDESVKISYTEEHIKQFTDWSPENGVEKTVVTFHEDPSFDIESAGRLVASADPDDIEIDDASPPETIRLSEQKTNTFEDSSGLSERSDLPSVTEPKSEVIILTERDIAVPPSKQGKSAEPPPRKHQKKNAAMKTNPEAQKAKHKPNIRRHNKR